MIRVTRLTDYAIVILASMARETEGRTYNTRELVEKTGFPMPTVSKLLKILVKKGLLKSQRGVKGGYKLARKPESLSISEIIGLLEGPIAMMVCNEAAPSDCVYECRCPVRSHWNVINWVVKTALDQISLKDMCYPEKFRIPQGDEIRNVIELLASRH